MEKMIDVPNMSHIIKLNERKNIIISGIKKINNLIESDSYFKAKLEELKNKILSKE